VLVALLPRDFRLRHGPEIVAVMVRRVSDTHRRRGAAAAALALSREAADVGGTAVRLRASGLLAGTGRDVVLGVRSLLRRPAFAAVAVVTLALGIGANAAIFSAVYGIVLRPLPYERPERLVVIWEDLRREGNPRFSVSPPNFRDFRGRATSFAGIAAQFGRGVSVKVGGVPELARGARVTVDYFGVLGVPALVGRTFIPSDTVSANGAVAVLSHELWTRRFGALPSAVGQTVTIDGSPHTIVGVMPAELTVPVFFKAPHVSAELWLPLTLPKEYQTRDAAVLQLIGRLKDGVGIEQARSELTTIARALEVNYPATNRDIGVTLVPIDEQIVGGLRQTLLTLFGAVAFLLLIAIANVAGLLLVRVLARRREVGVRLALGAGRLRIARQLLIESLVVAGAGGAVALLVAWGGLRALLAFAPPETPRLADVRVEPVVLGFSLLVTGVVGLAIGVWPALRGARVGLRASIAATGDRGSARTGVGRSALVVAQIALSIVLLAGAGLMVRTLSELGRVDVGFDVDRLLTMRFGMPATRAATPAERDAYFRQLVRRIEGIPGVQSAAFSTRLPLDPAYGVAPIAIQGRPVPAGERPIVGARIVSDRYFRTMGIPIRSGRDFAERDDATAPPVVIVNRAMAARFWPGGDPVGQRLGFGGPDSGWLEIVGVASDVSHDGVGSEPIPELYVPYAQSPESGGALVVRAARNPASLERAVRQAALSADPDQALIDVRPMREVAAGSTALRRFTMLLLGAFAGVALLLTAIGIYGTLAFTVSARTRELGIRAALGAAPADLLVLVGRQGLVLTALGFAIGIPGTLALTTLLSAQLYGVTPQDPVTIAAAVSVLAAVALGATYIPAWRAAKADPVRALSSE
jgi:putative ABC transport system permease protein